MNDDSLRALGGPDVPLPMRQRAADQLSERLDLQRITMAASADTRLVIPYLAVHNASRAIEFYSSVFGAALVGDPFRTDDGKISHAELRIGAVTIYLSDEFPAIDIVGPNASPGHAVSLVIHVADADLTMAAALASGADEQRPVTAQWGTRSGWFIDPFGHRWSPTSQTAQDQQQGAIQ